MPARVCLDRARDVIDPASVSTAGLSLLYRNSDREEFRPVAGPPDRANARNRPPAHRGPAATADSDPASRPAGRRAVSTKRRSLQRRDLPPHRITHRGPRAAATADSDPSSRSGRRSDERRRELLLRPRSTVQDHAPSPEQWGHSPRPKVVVDCVARIFGLAKNFRLDLGRAANRS